MAWEWSHTAEAYEAAEERLHRLPAQTLRVIYAEWKSHEPTPAEDPEDPDETGFDQQRYDDGLREAAALNTEQLATSIWGQMEAQATCDNGGHEAWCCPYGCGGHLVSFAPIKDRTQGVKP